MKDKLEKNWSYHVKRGDPFWRIRRVYWILRYFLADAFGIDDPKLHRHPKKDDSPNDWRF